MLRPKFFVRRFFSHVGEAIRSFSDLVSDPQTVLAKHPEDFKLYSLGSYDDVSGRLVPLDVPGFVANATDF